jgi:hypothetical protein
MASTDARPIPIKNTAYRVTFPILDADGDLVVSAASLANVLIKDTTVTAAAGTVTQLGTSGMYYLDLTAAEMNADTVTIIITTSTSGAKSTPIVLYPQETGDIKVDVQSLLGTAWLTPATAGTPDVNVKQWNGLTTVALPLIPTTAGRTLDVSTGGEAGVDWANVGSPTTSLALTGTTIATTQKVDIETIKTNPVVNAGTITFPTTATLASTTNITSITGNITGNLSGSVGSVSGAVGSVTGNVGGNVTGSVGSVVARVTANTDQFNGDATGAANIAFTTAAIGRGQVTGSPTTTNIPTTTFTPAGAALDQFKGRIITFDANTTTTALRGQSTDITSSTNAANPTFTVTALTTAPVSGDKFSVT